jgi:hypothetical protein
MYTLTDLNALLVNFVPMFDDEIVQMFDGEEYVSIEKISLGTKKYSGLLLVTALMGKQEKEKFAEEMLERCTEREALWGSPPTEKMNEIIGVGKSKNSKFTRLRAKTEIHKIIREQKNSVCILLGNNNIDAFLCYANLIAWLLESCDRLDFAYYMAINNIRNAKIRSQVSSWESNRVVHDGEEAEQLEYNRCLEIAVNLVKCGKNVDVVDAEDTRPTENKEDKEDIDYELSRSRISEVDKRAVSLNRILKYVKYDNENIALLAGMREEIPLDEFCKWSVEFSGKLETLISLLSENSQCIIAARNTVAYLENFYRREGERQDARWAGIRRFSNDERETYQLWSDRNWNRRNLALSFLKGGVDMHEFKKSFGSSPEKEAAMAIYMTEGPQDIALREVLELIGVSR